MPSNTQLGATRGVQVPVSIHNIREFAVVFKEVGTLSPSGDGGGVDVVVIDCIWDHAYIEIGAENNGLGRPIACACAGIWLF